MERHIIPYAQGKILDIGCGVGRHLLYFQNRKADIIGIDTSTCAIQTCKERGCKKTKVMDIFHSQFPEASFDTLLLFGHNIGIGGNLIGVKKLLTVARKLIKPGGVLLLTSIDVTKTKEKTHKEYHQKRLASKKYVGSVKIRIEYKESIGDWFEWLHVEPHVLKELGSKTGWQVKVLQHEKSGEYGAVLEAV